MYFARPTIAIAKMRESQSKSVTVKKILKMRDYSQAKSIPVGKRLRKFLFSKDYVHTKVLGAHDVFQFFFAVHLKTMRIRKRSKRRKIARPTFSTVCVSWIRFRGFKSHLELRIFSEFPLSTHHSIFTFSEVSVFMFEF